MEFLTLVRQSVYLAFPGSKAVNLKLIDEKPKTLNDLKDFLKKILYVFTINEWTLIRVILDGLICTPETAEILQTIFCRIRSDDPARTNTMKCLEKILKDLDPTTSKEDLCLTTSFSAPSPNLPKSQGYINNSSPDKLISKTIDAISTNMRKPPGNIPGDILDFVAEMQQAVTNPFDFWFNNYKRVLKIIILWLEGEMRGYHVGTPLFKRLNYYVSQGNFCFGNYQKRSYGM